MGKNKQNLLTNTFVVWVICLVCCLLWGTAFPFVKIGYSLFDIDTSSTASIILFAGLRFFIAGFLAILFGSILNKKRLVPKRKNLAKVFKLSLMQTVLQYLFFYVGLSNTTGSKASILNGASSFFAIIIACFIFKQERFTFAKAFGSVLGLVGIVLVNLDTASFSFDLKFFGEGFLLFSAISYAFSSVLIKRYSAYENPVTLSGYQFMFGGAFMSIVGFIFGGTFGKVDLSSIGMLLYLGMLSAVAYSLWGIVLKYNSVSKITVFGFMIPVFGFILSGMFLEESFAINLRSIISLVLVSMGIFIVNKFENQGDNTNGNS